MSERDPHQNAQILRQGCPIDSAALVLLCLHGRGSTAEDALTLGRAVAGSDTALIAPQAAAGTWYPQSFLAPLEFNQPHLDSALALLSRLLGDLREAGVLRERTAVIGFSQGACLACEFAARNPDAVSRAAVLTGGLIGAELVEARYSSSTHPVRFHMTTGVPDPHVPKERVALSADLLTQKGHAVSTAFYPDRPHLVSREEIATASVLFGHPGDAQA